MNVLHGVNMSKYCNDNEKNFIMAGYILCRSSELEILENAIKNKWSKLVANKDFGTEENAMTLYSWERHDIKKLTFKQFLHGLRCIEAPCRIFL